MLAFWLMLAAFGQAGVDHAPALSFSSDVASNVLTVENDESARALDAGWRTTNGSRRVRVASTRRSYHEPVRPSHGLFAMAGMPGTASLANHEFLRTATRKDVGRGPGGFDRPGHGPLCLC
jgi:hypothetical protein